MQKLLVASILSLAVLATASGPRSGLKTYIVNQQPMDSKAQAVLASARHPDHLVYECSPVQLDRDTLRFKRVKLAKKGTKD